MLLSPSWFAIPIPITSPIPVKPAERPRTRGKVKEEEGIHTDFTIKRELEEIMMNQVCATGEEITCYKGLKRVCYAPDALTSLIRIAIRLKFSSKSLEITVFSE